MTKSFVAHPNIRDLLWILFLATKWTTFDRMQPIIHPTIPPWAIARCIFESSSFDRVGSIFTKTCPIKYIPLSRKHTLLKWRKIKLRLGVNNRNLTHYYHKSTHTIYLMYLTQLDWSALLRARRKLQKSYFLTPHCLQHRKDFCSQFNKKDVATRDGSWLFFLELSIARVSPSSHRLEMIFARARGA